MLEEVKRKVQVWKREVYANGGGVLDESTGEGVGTGEEREAGTQEEAQGVWKENFEGVEKEAGRTEDKTADFGNE